MDPSIKLRVHVKQGRNMDFTKKKCIPCEGGVKPLNRSKINEYLPAINPAWEVIADQSLKRLFKFPSFKEAISFVNKVADLAEQEGHHPDITINYRKVTLELTTHAIGGLSENDFIMAAKIEPLTN